MTERTEYIGERAKDSRIAELERQLAESRQEVERLAWNLAGCLTIAESRKPSDFNTDMATPAIEAVNAMATEQAALRADAERLDFLENELNREQQEIRDFGKCCGQSLFRRNTPVTRKEIDRFRLDLDSRTFMAIDAARAAVGER